jgi:hypothetical protein
MLVSICPHCGIAVPYVEEFEGREVFCGGCGRHFLLRRSHEVPGGPATIIRLVDPQSATPAPSQLDLPAADCADPHNGSS